MAKQSKRDLLNEALSSLQQGSPQKALETLNVAWESNPDDAEVLSMRGIALAQVGRLDEATESFRKSIMLAPKVGQYFYNFAVHLRDLGERKEACEMAATALKLSPNYPGVKTLCDGLGVELERDPSFSIRDLLFKPDPPAYANSGSPMHYIGAISEHEQAWTVIGWVIVALSFVGLIALRLHVQFHMPAAGEPKGVPLLGGALLNGDPLSLGSMLLFIVAGILSMIWTLVDVIDRRSRALWFVPMTLFCLCGAPGIPQILYMVAGRK
jgi:tetratricopeptide (TPR) repeat protein